MQMPGRDTSFKGSYRYGFNGKEIDNETYGQGNEYDYGMRIYNPRVGRFLSVDPLTSKFVHLTPYQYASNTPIQAIDLDGLESINVNTNEVDNTLNPQTVSTYQNNKDSKPWEDLISFKPSEATLDKTLNRSPSVSVQNIEQAVGSQLNLDYYSVTITKLPAEFKTPEDFYSYFRTNLSTFIKGSETEFEPYDKQEGKIWNSNQPLSSVMRFQINTPIYNTDDASVLTSKASTNYWIFSPVFTLYDFGHPVSGNRQFGITTNDNGTFTLFTRGADRIHSAADRDIGGQSIFKGANALWTKTMLNVVTYINLNGGQATANPHVWKRIDWNNDYLKKK